MEFSWQEYWIDLPFLSPGDLADPGIKPEIPTLQADSLLYELPGKHIQCYLSKNKCDLWFSLEFNLCWIKHSMTYSWGRGGNVSAYSKSPRLNKQSHLGLVYLKIALCVYTHTHTHTPFANRFQMASGICAFHISSHSSNDTQFIWYHSESLRRPFHVNIFSTLYHLHLVLNKMSKSVIQCSWPLCML